MNAIKIDCLRHQGGGPHLPRVPHFHVNRPLIILDQKYVLKSGSTDEQCLNEEVKKKKFSELHFDQDIGSACKLTKAGFLSKFCNLFLYYYY